jgi:pyruvate formate lyase activating enzyme
MASSGLIFDIRRYSIHDGPGIRTTVFFKGCPLSCKWCHNPEGIGFQKELMFHQKRCILCGDCIKVCPQHAISQKNQEIFVDRGKCNVSEKCTSVCPSDALQIVGKEMTADEVIMITEKDRTFYSQSGGGVTFSGGEPLAQPRFLLSILNACRERGISTTVDTCGFSTQAIFEKILPLVDHILIDIKLMDDEKHIQWTGVSNKQILANIQYLSTRASNILVRVPVIPGVNDDDENLSATAKFIQNLPAVPPVEFLAYHNMAEGKINALGKINEYMEKVKPSKDFIEHCSHIFTEKDIQVLGSESI